MPRVFHINNNIVTRNLGEQRQARRTLGMRLFRSTLVSSASRYVELMEVNINSADLGQFRCRLTKGL